MKSKRSLTRLQWYGPSPFALLGSSVLLFIFYFGNRVKATFCFAFVSCVLVDFHLVFHVWLFLSFCVLLVMTYIASSPLGDIGKHRYGYVKLSSMIDIFTIDQIRYNN